MLLGWLLLLLLLLLLLMLMLMLRIGWRLVGIRRMGRRARGDGVRGRHRKTIIHTHVDASRIVIHLVLLCRGGQEPGRATLLLLLHAHAPGRRCLGDVGHLHRGRRRGHERWVPTTTGIGVGVGDERHGIVRRGAHAVDRRMRGSCCGHGHAGALVVGRLHGARMLHGA
ncbi:hypothetical protein BDZ97DRAFT_1807738 [Flammula alnicola]|nr:hypothetical protein BDZ97DRAFT_1807738 [Flammula alnicola]